VGSRQQRKAQLRSQIRETALRLFHERGFDETRVQDVIELVGISEKTFFNYFPSKLELLETTSAEMISAYRALLEYELADPERPVRARLTEIVELWAESFAADQEFLAVVVTRTPAFFGSSGSMRDEQRATQLLLAELFRQGQKADEIRPDADPVQLAEVLTAVLLLTTVNWLDRWWGADRESLRDRLFGAVGVVLQGALASAPSKGRTLPGVFDDSA
jgi:AcrR family transcriptional regulator